MQSRIDSELQKLQADPPGNISVRRLGERHWKALLLGPCGTPYEGGIFQVDVRFERSYPFTPPVLHFDTSIWHCNISRCGTICMDILKDRWSPALPVRAVLLGLSSMLDPAGQNADDPLNSTAARMFVTDPRSFAAHAAAWTALYAQGQGVHVRPGVSSGHTRSAVSRRRRRREPLAPETDGGAGRTKGRVKRSH